MATYKAEYFKFDEGGNRWDLYYFRTSADLIVETTNRLILTLDERTKISNFLTTFNDKNKLVQVDADGKILVGLVPDLSDTYLKKNAPTFDGTLSGNTGAFNYINAYNTTNKKLVIGNRLQEQSATYITLKDNPDGEGEMELYANAGIKLTSNNSVIDVDDSWIRNVKAPLRDDEAVNKEYVDNKVSSGFTTRTPVKAASTGNIDITIALNALDGFTLSAGDTVLIKDQTTATQNGVYVLSDASKIPQKVTRDSAVGSAVFVMHGDTNNDYIYHCSTKDDWVAFSKPDTIKAKLAGGLLKTGTELSIADEGVTNGMLKGSIEYTKLANIPALNSGEMPSTWADPKDNLSVSLFTHFSYIYNAIKTLRGTDNYNTNNAQTIKGAYTNAAAAQTTASNAMAAIPKITSGTGNPATTGAKNGDLYFLELSTV